MPHRHSLFTSIARSSSQLVACNHSLYQLKQWERNAHFRKTLLRYVEGEVVLAIFNSPLLAGIDTSIS